MHQNADGTQDMMNRHLVPANAKLRAALERLSYTPKQTQTADTHATLNRENII